MKKIFLVNFMSLISSLAFAQWTSNGNVISTTQNVGIGTTAPGYLLDVNGNMRAKNIVFPSGSQLSMVLGDNFTYQGRSMGHYALAWMPDLWNTGGPALWQSAFGGIKFFTAGQFRMGINSSGNVGIGTENPAYKLDVNGDVRFFNFVLEGNSSITRSLTDNFAYQSKNVGHNSFGWYVDSWDTSSASLWQSGVGGMRFFTGGQFRMAIHRSGNIGIGTDSPTQKLDVNGNIKGNNIYSNGTVFANEVKVEATAWSDFVFDKEYKLLPLNEVKAHIEEYKHLPDMPSEKQVIEEGINVAEMQAKLLQKIEELTLYIIEQGNKNKELEQQIKELKASLIKK